MVKKSGTVQKVKRKFHNLASSLRILVIEAPYYTDIGEILLLKTKDILLQNTCPYDVVRVEGALEIPQALAAAAKANLFGRRKTQYQGAVALGCVIRGQTSHYEIVSQNTNYWLMKIALKHGIPLGNGILTVDTYEQARDRALGTQGSSKGEDAVRACLGLIELQNIFARVSFKKNK